MEHVLVIVIASFTYTNPWEQTTWDQAALTRRTGEKRRMYCGVRLTYCKAREAQWNSVKTNVQFCTWNGVNPCDRTGWECSVQRNSDEQKIEHKTTQYPCWLERRQPDSPRYAQWQTQQIEKKLWQVKFWLNI